MYKKNILFLSFILGVSQLVAVEDCIDLTLRCLHIESVSIFEGDRYGNFKNDYVAVLSDGSAWKIQPSDKKIFERWGINDTIHIAVQTSFYWFRREHKFELINHTQNQSARAMLVQYPQESLVIVHDLTYLADTKIYSSFAGPDDYYFEYTEIYEKKLTLNDGSSWLLSKEGRFKDYHVGDRVYIGFNKKNDKQCNYFLIAGTEREAVWNWAYPQ